MPNDFHSGFVAIAGRPNVGKSTLLNHMAGIRLAIVSPKAQTTRHAIRAVVDDDRTQIVFIDTPGMHRPTTRLGRFMVQAAWDAFVDSDVAILMTDATRPGPDSVERNFCRKASETGLRMILCINKTDRVKKESLLPIIGAFADAYPFEAIIPVSASTGDGVPVLLSEIRRMLPEGPRYFPADMSTDQTERTLVGEIIRERILGLTSEEVPHGTAVEIESFDELDGTGAKIGEEDTSARTLVRIGARILCEKESHKAILIGEGGAKVKQIGTEARIAIEKMLGCHVHIDLRVKVKEDWKNNRGLLRELGYGKEN